MLHLLLRRKTLAMCIVGCLITSVGGVKAYNTAGYVSSRSIDGLMQNQACKGVVLDAKNQSIIGASILVKGTTVGTVTNIDGEFSIPNVKKGTVLEISYIGYVKQQVVWNGQPLKIILKEDAKALDEVVVTALGIKRQTKALSYNVQELKADQLNTAANASFTNALNGKIAGVTINQGSAGAGSAARVVMRGAKSISKSNNALYVVDGVPLFNHEMKQGTGQFDSNGSTDAAADINPDDIASVTVLTGASAAALYGSAAANGAILITTKSGAAGKMKLDYSLTTEWGKPLKLPEFQNIYGSDGSARSWGNRLPTDFEGYEVKDFFNTAFTHTHNLSVSGGSSMNKTYVSAGFTNTDGLVPNNNYRRLNFTGRNTTSLLKDRLKISLGLNYINEYHRNMINQGEYANPMVAAYLMPRSESNFTARQFEAFDTNRNIWVQNWAVGQGDFTLQNPYWQAYRNLREGHRERYVTMLNTSFDIKKWNDAEKWTIAGRVNYDKTNFTNTDKRYASTIPTLIAGSKNGYYGEGLGYTKQIYADIISTINKNLMLGEQHFSVNASLGASIQDSRYDNQLVEGPLSDKGFPNLFNIFNINQSSDKTGLIPSGWHDQTQSVFASAELGWNSYLFLTLTGRNDWASQLANSPQLSFFYPSVGLSAVVTEMLPENMKSKVQTFLDYFKVRAAYASVASPFERGLTTPTYKLDAQTKTYNPVTYYPIGNLYPERTDSYEVGFSSKWLKNLLSLDMSFYRTITKNQTIDVTVDPSSGYSGMYIQTGSVRNQGVELAAGLHLGKRTGWFYDCNFTFSCNENKIVNLASDYVNPITKKHEGINTLDKGGLGGLKYLLKANGTLGDIYTNATLSRDVNGEVYVAEDGNLSLTNLSNEEAVKLGSVLPKANYGWSNELGYKNFSAGFLLTARQGGLVVSMTQAAMDYSGVSKATAVARNNGGVRVGDFKVDAEKYYTAIGKNRLPQYYTYDATNVRLAEAHISYKLDRKYLRNIADVTFSVVGKNLAFLYCKAPFDPETISGTSTFVQGLDYFMMPSQRSVGFNVKLSF